MNYAASAWGREFHSLDVDEALGGGAAGVGKSLVLMMDPMEQMVVEHARCQTGEVPWGHSRGWALHIRKEFPRLEQTIARSHLIFPQTTSPGPRWDAQKHMWTWPSGFKFQFGHVHDSAAVMNYRSNEYTHVGIDEAYELESKDIYDELVSRVRSADPVLSKMLKVRAMSNPSGNWLREYFVDPAPEGRAIVKKRIKLGDGAEVERRRMFLPGRLTDNPDPTFRANYEANLRDKPTHIRAALFDGNWYVVQGAFFADDFDPGRVVIKPFAIPSNWKRFRSGDWGYKAPCVILWWAVAPDGELICYRERTYNGPTAKTLMYADEVAESIKSIEMAHGEWNRVKNCSRLTGPMDNQLWEERGKRGLMGVSMADDMAAVGVYWTKATKGRHQAAMQMVKRLKQRGYKDRPGIMWFENCSQCIRTIPALGTDPTDPEVPAKGGPDHHYDACSYACAANMLPSAPGNEYRDDDDEFEAPAAAGKLGSSFGYGMH